MKKKTIALLLACMMVLGVAIGGTMAWLTDKTDNVVNTFTIGDINIEIDETGATKNNDGDLAKGYDFVPGDTLSKDPYVKVMEDSEDCYLFIHVEEEYNLNVPYTKADGSSATEKLMTYSIDDSVWTPVNGQAGYWYCKVTNVPEEIEGPRAYYLPFNILKDKEVKISQYITKEMIKGNGSAENPGLETHLPKLMFSAAAVQIKNLADMTKIEGNENPTAEQLEAANVLAAWNELPESFTA